MLSNSRSSMYYTPTYKNTPAAEEKSLSFIYAAMSPTEANQKIKERAKNLAIKAEGLWLLRESRQEGMLSADQVGSLSRRFAYTQTGWKPVATSDIEEMQSEIIPLTRESASPAIINQLLAELEKYGLAPNNQIKPLLKTEATHHQVLNDYMQQSVVPVFKPGS